MKVESYKDILEDITNIQKLINDNHPFDKNQLPQLLKFYKTEI